MPIFKRKPKTFKEKREAFGIKRNPGTTKYILPTGEPYRIHDRGPMVSKLNEINPQKRALREKALKQMDKLKNRLELLEKTKPKSIADVLKIKTEIKQIKAKREEITKKLNAKLSQIRRNRDTQRSNKQTVALFKNLFALAYPEKSNNMFNRLSVSAIPEYVRIAYSEYVNKHFDVNKFSFENLQKNDAQLIFENAKYEYRQLQEKKKLIKK